MLSRSLLITVLAGEEAVVLWDDPLRYLKMHNWDLLKAEEMIRATAAWRNSFRCHPHMRRQVWKDHCRAKYSRKLVRRRIG